LFHQFLLHCHAVDIPGIIAQSGQCDKLISAKSLCSLGKGKRPL
jgi:hypothetical protein